MKTDAQRLPDGTYVMPNGFTLKREHDTLTPNGNRFDGRWVYRDHNGALIDYDKYINDLTERHNINIYTDLNVRTHVI